MKNWPAHPLILLTDDEPTVRNLIRLALEKEYDTLVAADAKEALNVSRGSDRKIDLLLTDIDMPGMNGWELYEVLRAERPGLKVLFISGADHPARGEHQSLPFLGKPFDIGTLKATVRTVLDAVAEQSILVVDSNAQRRARTERILLDGGYAVRTAASAEEAEAISDSTDRIDLVISAVNMAGNTGVHLADHVTASKRRIHTLLISHAAPMERNRIPGFAQQPEFLENPFSPEVLLARVRELLNRPRP